MKPRLLAEMLVKAKPSGRRLLLEAIIPSISFYIELDLEESRVPAINLKTGKRVQVKPETLQTRTDLYVSPQAQQSQPQQQSHAQPTSQMPDTDEIDIDAPVSGDSKPDTSWYDFLNKGLDNTTFAEIFNTQKGKQLEEFQEYLQGVYFDFIDKLLEEFRVLRKHAEPESFSGNEEDFGLNLNSRSDPYRYSPSEVINKILIAPAIAKPRFVYKTTGERGNFFTTNPKPDDTISDIAIESMFLPRISLGLDFSKVDKESITKKLQEKMEVFGKKIGELAENIASEKIGSPDWRPNEMVPEDYYA